MSSIQEVGDIFGAGKGPAQAMLRSPTILIFSVGLWGMNLFFYKLFGIDYKYVLMYDLVEMEQEENERNKKKRRKKKEKMENDDGDDIMSTDSMDLTSLMTSAAATGISLTPPKSKRKNTDPSLSSIDSTDAFKINDPEDQCKPSSAKSSPPSTNEDTTAINTATLELQQLQQEFSYGVSITWFKLVVFSIVLLCLLHFTTHFWMDHLGRSSIGAVFSFYGAVLVYIFLPLQSNEWLRRAFVITLQRSFELINPRCSCIFMNGIPRKIPFVDVFFADAMCSLSKVFFDWGMLLHQASHYPDPVPAAAHNIILPSLCAAVPYIIRARQCLIMHTVGRLQQDPKRYQHMMNAFKYSTSIFPLILSAYQKTLSDHHAAAKWDATLTFLLVINASYSLYWDIVMDWGMMQDPFKLAQTVVGCTTPFMPVSAVDNDGIMSNGSMPMQGPTSSNGGNKGHDDHLPLSPHMRNRPCYHFCLRPRLRFGLTLSALIVIADSFLRFSWLLRFVAKFPSHDAFVLCTQFLEVFRRAIWNLLRVEWENIKQKDAAAKGKEKQDPVMEEEDWDPSGGSSTVRLSNKSLIQQRINSTTTPGSVEMKSLL
ncbi:EXS family protein [Nitzschia inconspicua]|uniref:EXS family protein n=1 Tax=Nitzschia inconspicua TaxID=303405 RepID=A0A9K3LCV3_9STRA|nr:EXS family protein [Nitzschia inconspicua]